MLPGFTRFTQDAVYPYGSARARTEFRADDRPLHAQVRRPREDFGKICIAQRENARRFPHALIRKPLTIDDYLGARPIATPLGLFDCVMPCAGAEAFLVMREDSPPRSTCRLPACWPPSSDTMRFPTIRSRFAAAGRWTATSIWAMAGVTPDDVDLVETYDDYPVISMMQMEDLGFCAKGEGPGFVASHTLHRGRHVPAQHLGRPALGRTGRRRRRLSRPGRSNAPAHRANLGAAVTDAKHRPSRGSA